MHQTFGLDITGIVHTWVETEIVCCCQALIVAIANLLHVYPWAVIAASPVGMGRAKKDELGPKYTAQTFWVNCLCTIWIYSLTQCC